MYNRTPTLQRAKPPSSYRCVILPRLSVFTANARALERRGVASCERVCETRAVGQRRVKSRGDFKVPALGGRSSPGSRLIRQMTRRPPIVRHVLGRCPPAGRPSHGTRTHLVLLAAVNIYQLNARLNSQLIDRFCLSSIAVVSTRPGICEFHAENSKARSRKITVVRRFGPNLYC